jgi:fermentation-respiration switch protein FrsA (DUF1100 family)
MSSLNEIPLEKAHFTTIVAFGLIAYLIIGATIYHTQQHVIFRSGGPWFDPPRHLPVEELFVETADGERLYAWWMETAKAEKTVLFFQGNGRNLTHCARRLTTLRHIGVNALLLDYRGYGRSSGEVKKERDLYADGAAAFEFLVNRKHIRPQDIIVWGRSLGGAVAAEIAQNKPISALVLESTFFSLDHLARQKYWFLPTGLLLKFHFANGDKLKHVEAPVIVIHSVEDGYVPFSQASALFEAANQPKRMIRTTGSHLDLFDLNNDAVASLLECLAL